MHEENQKKRFGKTVNRLKVGNCLRGFGIIGALLLIPLQLFLKQFLIGVENKLIESIQTNFILDVDKFVIQLLVLFREILNYRNCCYAGLALFLAADNLLAFKVFFAYSFGVFLIIACKLIYSDPRPFWAD